jgi:4-hydroxy-tetrahydrodipicolinate synthase
MAELVNAARAGDFAAAREAHRRLAPWMSAAFIESNPLPVKAALAAMARAENVLRSPLVPLAAPHEPVVRAALVGAGAVVA